MNSYVSSLHDGVSIKKRRVHLLALSIHRTSFDFSITMIITLRQCTIFLTSKQRLCHRANSLTSITASSRPKSTTNQFAFKPYANTQTFSSNPRLHIIDLNHKKKQGPDSQASALADRSTHLGSHHLPLHLHQRQVLDPVHRHCQLTCFTEPAKPEAEIRQRFCEWAAGANTTNKLFPPRY